MAMEGCLLWGMQGRAVNRWGRRSVGGLHGWELVRWVWGVCLDRLWEGDVFGV